MLRRTVEEATWNEVKALALKGVQEVREYKRRYPEGEAAAPVVGFADAGRHGLRAASSWCIQPLLRAGDGHAHRGARPLRPRGRRHRRALRAPSTAATSTLSIDSKVQFFAWQRLRDAVKEHNALSGSAGGARRARPARCWPWPTTAVTTR